MLINGLPGEHLNANDRGLQYGDGVFRTMRVRDGQILHWQQHYNKLQHDCSALALACPSIQILRVELDQLIQTRRDGIAKIIITRGTGNRGYAPPARPLVNRILNITPSPVYPDSFASSGVSMHICNLRLGHQARLAGIKHLNRLENVLAAAEWNDANIAEGLLMDESGHIIEATRSNLFLVKDGALFTPDLSRCGVAGVQRERVMDWARQGGILCNIADLLLDDLLVADEVFVVNSVIGLWPVREMPGFRREYFPVSLLIQEWLNHASD
jgi:4-amino-4-deoxychorismate lyase